MNKKQFSQTINNVLEFLPNDSEIMFEINGEFIKVEDVNLYVKSSKYSGVLYLTHE